MQHHNYVCIAAGIFVVAAAFHLMRAALGWSVVINGVEIPTLVSWMAVVLLGFMALRGLTLCLQKHK